MFREQYTTSVPAENSEIQLIFGVENIQMLAEVAHILHYFTQWYVPVFMQFVQFR